MNQDKNVLAEAPVWELIAKLSIPTVIITLVMEIYNMADIFFISKTGNADYVNAISVCMPVFTIIQAFGTLIGAGGCTAISIALGRKENARTKNISAFCFWLSLALGVVLTFLMNVFADSLVDLLGATNSYKDYAITYLKIIGYGSIIMLFSNAFVNILRADGSVKESMVANLSGTFLNIILDPILILGFNMGVAGAAIATVLGNTLSLVIVLKVYRKKSEFLSFDIKYLSFSIENSCQILALGFPLAIGTLFMSFAYMVMNNLLKTYDANAQGAFGICRTIMLLSTMIQMGICMGMQPAISYNFGAKNTKRVKEIILKTGIVTVLFGALLSLVIIVFRDAVLSAFINDSAVLSYADRMIVGCLCTAAIYGVYQMSVTALQSLERPMQSTIITAMRQGVVIIPAMLILNALLGFNGLVYCFAVTDIVAAFCGVILLKKCF